jgi:hypothetical protein
MTTPSGAIGQTAHRHTHRTKAEAEQCPLCGSPISAATRARLDEKLRAELASAEQSLRDQFAGERQQVAAKAAADIAKARADAGAQVEKIRKEATKTAAAALAPKIAEAVAQAVQAERTKAYGDKLALEQQLEEMKRKLQRKSAHDIGEPAEVDLHAALVSAFPEDDILRVAKGVKGPDVVMEVIYQDHVVGKIIIDSKDHLRWSNKFTQKLRTDQLSESADFAILSTTTFPAGKEQIHVQDHVIVASPARVLALVEFLRRLVIQSYIQRLSIEARNEKAEAIFAFVVSPACSDLIERIGKLTGELNAIDRAETVAHEKVWTKRADLNRAIRSAYEHFAATINRIIETAPGDNEP